VTTRIDVGPAASTVAALCDKVSDDQLELATPCEHYTVAALLDHLMALSVAFKVPAQKAVAEPGGQAELAEESRPGQATAKHLRADWRDQLPQRLEDLAAAWREPTAWEGETQAGGVTMPGDLTGKVAITELVLHGWDLARATGQPFDGDSDSLRAALDFTSMMAQPGGEGGRTGLFGPVVDGYPCESDLDRVLTLSGRDPSWSR
jgi:uncharacterized protein (TIGR03086 family)